jgi:hypothetical protein
MFFPLNAAVELALDSNRVIGLRLTKLAAGGFEAFEEAHLMLSEKIGAAAEATFTLMTGGTSAAVINRYQEHVAANVSRLSRRSAKSYR